MPKKTENAERLLIVIAHPSKEGHNRYMLKRITENLDSLGRKYEIIDIYKEKFNPLMLESEHLHATKKELGQDILSIQEKVNKTSRLIFIFPVWWNSPPAGMKGFIERVFTSGYAYKYVKVFKFFRVPKPLLKGKKAAVFITTGAPKIAFWTILGARAAKIIKLDTLRFIGIKSRVFQYGNAYKVNPLVEKKLDALTKKGLNWLLK